MAECVCGHDQIVHKSWDDDGKIVPGACGATMKRGYGSDICGCPRFQTKGETTYDHV